MKSCSTTNAVFLAWRINLDKEKEEEEEEEEEKEEEEKEEECGRCGSVML